MEAFPVFVGQERYIALRVLKEAVKKLKSGGLYMGVCEALRNAGGGSYERTRIKRWVKDVLGANVYLDRWLVVQQKAGVDGFEGANSIWHAKTQYFIHPASLLKEERAVLQKLKNTRLAWVRWMIEQVEQSR